MPRLGGYIFTNVFKRSGYLCDLEYPLYSAVCSRHGCVISTPPFSCCVCWGPSQVNMSNRPSTQEISQHSFHMGGPPLLAWVHHQPRDRTQPLQIDGPLLTILREHISGCTVRKTWIGKHRIFFSPYSIHPYACTQCGRNSRWQILSGTNPIFEMKTGMTVDGRAQPCILCSLVVCCYYYKVVIRSDRNFHRQ